MARGFYRVVLCAFAIRENGETLIVMVRARTRFIDDLGTSRQATMQKTWHVHENTTYRGGTFLPKFSKSGSLSL
jgi:hypothetical protein